MQPLANSKAAVRIGRIVHIGRVVNTDGSSPDKLRRRACVHRPRCGPPILVPKRVYLPLFAMSESVNLVACRTFVFEMWVGVPLGP